MKWVTIVTFVVTFVTMGFGQTESVKVSWDANSESDLSGYRLHYGILSGNYKTVVNVGNVTSHEIGGLEIGKTYYFALTAYDTSGNESGFSNEVSELIDVTDTTPPNPPGGVRSERVIKVTTSTIIEFN